MSVVRIDSSARRTCGWQARAYVAKDQPRLTCFFSDRTYGGKQHALARALLEEVVLERRARQLKRKLAR